MVVNIQDDILRLDALGLFGRLLGDKATGGRILWATEAYAAGGPLYQPGAEIRAGLLTGENAGLLKTRARRAMEERTARTRRHGEVFTPLWVVKKMLDKADEVWFGRREGFSRLTEEGKVRFTRKRSWQRYVDARRMELTCGEAPFLATRYDVETGEALPVPARLGLLDRKLRAVSENAADREEWKRWAKRALEATYGYELAGDNLVIARVNLLLSVEEHYLARWGEKPEAAWLGRLTNTIVWNLWQMNGLTGRIPVPPRPEAEQLSLFASAELAQPPAPCRLRDWRSGRTHDYQALRKEGEKKMKFDFIIGNPPYQDETVGDQKTFAPPIYHLFLDSAYQIADKVELIHPARFLFNAGSTPKAWNQKMLNDPHLKVIFHEQNSAKVFANTDIKGGIVITLHDRNKEYGAIETYTAFDELNAIIKKVYHSKAFDSFQKIVVTRTAYRLTEKLHKDHPEARYKDDGQGNNLGQLSKGHDYDMSTNIFESLPQCFFDSKPKDGNRYIQIYGREKNARVYKYIRSDYVNTVSNLYKYKIFVPKANGSGALGEVLTTPVIGQPVIGHTESFISIGCFDIEEEANACYKYICTKFARCMLGILKVTQDNPPDKWKYVPLQNFTPASDIDWSQSVAEIDRQLYAKYGLDEAEIAFIESHVKEMN